MPLFYWVLWIIPLQCYNTAVLLTNRDKRVIIWIQIYNKNGSEKPCDQFFDKRTSPKVELHVQHACSSRRTKTVVQCFVSLVHSYSYFPLTNGVMTVFWSSWSFTLLCCQICICAHKTNIYSCFAQNSYLLCNLLVRRLCFIQLLTLFSLARSLSIQQGSTENKVFL